MSKSLLALIIFIPCAILAIPAWLIMRALNARAEKRREQRAAIESAHWDAEMAKVREELKRQ